MFPYSLMFTKWISPKDPRGSSIKFTLQKMLSYYLSNFYRSPKI